MASNKNTWNLKNRKRKTSKLEIKTGITFLLYGYECNKRGGRLMAQSVTFNQITLITDGCSNQGISPEEAARQALNQAITTNVIGITEQEILGEHGRIEVEKIALAGGGLYQIVPIEQVAKTVQMVTRQAMNRTIQQAVHTQLMEIMGKGDLNEIVPKKRLEVAKMVDQMAEYSHLNVLLLIDTSASMLNKMKKLEEAIFDFQLSLQSRTGKSNLSIVTFPGRNDVISIRVPWTDEIEQIRNVLYKMKPGGNTPTGTAIQASIAHFDRLKNKSLGVLDEYMV